jgi:hypothetical protein
MTHRRCRNFLDQSNKVAARFLEVEQDGTEFKLRLTSRQNVADASSAYVTLTHCWDGVDMPCKTTKHNVDRYFRGIDFATLPLSLREAVALTAALSLRYLWVDCLCIVQDDAADWQHESGKMSEIYRGALLTISATFAENSRVGCGLARVLSPATHFKTVPVDADTTSLIVPVRTDLVSGPEHGNISQKAPVNKRAWTLQEKILSRRILHVGPQQFTWQCATLLETEDGIDWTTEAGNDASRRPLHSHEIVYEDDCPYARFEMCAQWWTWVNDFSQRHLTFARDKYAALAGITRLYQEIACDEPVLGLWKRDLPLHLLWTVLALPGSVFEERRPSCTWMSYSHHSPHSVVNTEVLLCTNLDDRTNSSLQVLYQASVVD